ncbi:MAG: sugar ABC transporter permease, partial [Deinococcota bacterium]|nr:sugar ABC transporter permease [Deinococcota bacterium]
LDLPPQPWLQSPQTAMVSIVILTTWAGLGGGMLIYLAALQGISSDLYEAAELEGANPWQRLIHITFPSIRFVMLAMLILQFIGIMQIFTEPFVLTGGGPANATGTVALLLYRYAFNYGNYGAAGALGFMLFVVLVTLSLLYFRLTRRYAD